MMNKKAIFYLLILFFTVVIFQSCDKDYGDAPPEINILWPNAHKSFTFEDTIKVQVEVKDKYVVKTVSIALVDQNRVLVLPKQSFEIDRKEKYIEAKMLLNNVNMHSDTYYIHLEATNGVAKVTKLLPIKYSAKDMQIMGLLAITKVDNNNVEIKLLDTVSEISSFANFNVDYLTSSLSSKYSKLIISGEKHADFHAIDLNTKETEWTILNLSNGDMPYFTNLHTNENRIFVGIRPSKLLEYTWDGSKMHSYNIVRDCNVNKTLNFQNRILIQTTDILGGGKRLLQFYQASSELVTQHTTNIVVVDWFWDGERVLVFSTNGNYSSIQKYNYTNSQFTSIHNINNLIKRVIQINNTDFIIATENQIMLYKNGINQSLNSILDIDAVEKMLYEPISESLFLSQNNKLLQYSYPELMLKNEFDFGNEILDIHLWYNR